MTRAIVALMLLACSPPRARSAAPAPAAKAPAPAASRSSAPPAPAFQQPASCPPALTWEDGSAIVLPEVCGEREAFFLHQDECCRYDSACVGPEGARAHRKLEQCERSRAAEKPPGDPPRPECEAGQRQWQPRHCEFVSCRDGRFVPSGNEMIDCARPLGLHLRFKRDTSALSVLDLGWIENLAVSAEALGLRSLTVVGRQSWYEQPDARAKVPLSLQRARAVRDALAKVTRIPIAVEDGGTHARRHVSGEEDARSVEIRMPPLTRDTLPPESAPFRLPWTICESSVTFRTTITVKPDDGAIRVEVCRNQTCSHDAFSAELQAKWPGAMGSRLTGPLAGNLSLEATRQQLIRNGINPFGEKSGPATFHLWVQFKDAAIDQNDTYRLRILRRDKEVALDWSGKLTFETTRRHATRDVPPCLEATQEVKGF